MTALAARFLLTSGHVVATGLAAHALPLEGNEVCASACVLDAVGRQWSCR